MKFHIGKRGAIVALVSLLAPSAAHAACVLPYSFGLSPYTVAQSAQVNANFQALAACIGAIQGGGGGGGGSGTVNTGASPALAQYQGTGTTVGPATISGDAILTAGGALTVTKSNGTSFGGMAFQAPAAVSIAGGIVTGLAAPTHPTDAATKAYVDSLLTGGTINTGSAPQIAQYQGAGSTTLGGATISGDATLAAGGALTVVSANGNPFLGMAFQAPNAVAITGGTASGLAETGGSRTGGTLTGVTIDSTSTLNGSTLNGGILSGGSGSGLTLTSLPACVNPGDACPKSYIDATQQNGNPHAPVAYATAAVLPNTPAYNNGAGTLTDQSAGTVLVVDGQNVTVLGTRILVQTQAAGAQNGIYTLTTAGVAGVTPWVLTRASDFNAVAAGNVATGANTFVSATAYGLTKGTANDGNSYAMNTTGAITLGTTALVWVQLNNVTTYTAAAPISLAGSVFGFAAIPATSVPANTTGGSATPLSSIAYGTGANQLLQLNGSAQVPAANLPPSGTNITGPAIVGRVTNTLGPATAAYTPSNGADTTVSLVHGATAAGQCAQFNDTAGTIVGAACSGGGGGGSTPPTAFYVATAANGGSDVHTGTFASPFATLTHAISVAATSNVKTIYVRAGTYNVASSGSSCFSNAFGIGVTAGNEGLTISYWPPDGVNTAVINGSNATSIGLCIFNGGNGVSVIGLSFTNWINTGIRVAGGTTPGQGATGVTISDNVVTGTTGVFGAGIELIGNVQGAKILRNDIETINDQGIKWADSGVGNGGGSNIDIEYNFLRNTCIGFSDCGPIYLQNLQCANATCSSGIIIAHNYMTGTVTGSYGIYLDDWASYVTSEYNTILLGSSTATFPACGIIHGGQNNVFRYNICDLGGAGGAMTNRGPLLTQNSTHGTPLMTGNVWQDNIIVCKSSSAPCGSGYKTFSPNPTNPTDVRSNLYYNFTTQTGGVSGVANTAGAGATIDSNPTGANPQVRCYAGAVDQAGPAAATPVFFSGGGAYAWGPQSPALGNTNIPFNLPHTGSSVPSWTSTC